MVYVIFGVVLILCGVVLIWAATLGREWNSTHDRLFRRTEHVSRRQERYNSVAFLAGGAVAVVAGVTLIAHG